MDPIAERIALNEALFREVNENIRKVAGQGRHDDAHFICECGESTCEERIALPIAVYRSVREDPLHFFVKPGHEIPSAERVVERREGFFVIEKPPEALHVLEGDGA
jgi:hypothetical protein